MSQMSRGKPTLVLFHQVSLGQMSRGKPTLVLFHQVS